MYRGSEGDKEEALSSARKSNRKIEWVRHQEQANILQNDFNGKVMELRIEALKESQRPMT